MFDSDTDVISEETETTVQSTELETQSQDESSSVAEPPQQEPDEPSDDDDGDMATSLPSASSWWLALEERRKSRNEPPRNKWMALLFGQVIALVASSMNAASFTLARHKVDTQLFQLFLMYVLLSAHLWLRSTKRGTDHGNEDGLYRLPGTRIRLQMPWWIYLMMSVLDIVPNFMQLVSFHYTSLTSTTLLGSLTVPSTMILSSRFLSRSFGRHHYVGVCLCVIGGGLTVWADFFDPQTVDASSNVHSYIGDMLAIIAAFIYGLGDVISEYCVKNVDRYELLGMLGLYGAIFTGLTFPWIDHEALAGVVHGRTKSEQMQLVGVYVWYIASVLGYYMTEALFYVTSDATLLNLSMQASNLWAILFSFVAYHIIPPLLFYPALVLVVSGVCVYEWKSPGTRDNNDDRGQEADPFPQPSLNHYSSIRATEGESPIV